MLSKVLVANRGEIALRIVRGCRDLGIKSAAVYSDADRMSSHVRYADEAHYIGPSEASQSYLNGDRILEVAKACGADGIHPGYGFLAENAEFAEKVTAAGLTFVGPSPDSIRSLGDKASARRIAMDANVPVVPGSPEVDSVEDALQHAEQIGYPVMVKALAGGGGRGIRMVHSADQMASSTSAAMQEAEAAFGDHRIFIEKLLSPVRHIEIQIIADAHGNVVSLGERECSIQRRHQKIIEECPSVAVSPTLRRAMSRASKRLARAVGYHTVGTVEFLVTEDGSFYFLEMNTRLQVEHPVTEITTGVDLVKDMILVAGGEELSYDESDLLTRGWAIECRIVAEDPFNNFLPAVGHVLLARESAGPGVRVESALYDGIEVTPYYDSLLAKVTAWGRNREGARSRMKRALEEFSVIGVATNIPYLQQILEMPDFIEGRLDTGFLDRHEIKPTEPLERQKEAAALAALLHVTGNGDSAAAAPISTTTQSSASTGNGRISPWRRQMNRKGMGRWPRSI